MHVPCSRFLSGTAVAAFLALIMTGCAGGPGASNGTGDQGGSAPSSTGYPLTIPNCGIEVTLDAPPKRVVLLDSSPVTYLHALGVMDKVVARAGAYPDAYYDDATRAELERIPLLTDKLDSSGHLQISQEVVMAQKPDLVLGSTENLNRETLAASGIPMLEEPAFCPEGIEHPDFAVIGEQLKTYAHAFGIDDRGDQEARHVADRVRAVSSPVRGGKRRTAAVLYPTVGGGVTYAYGTKSMAQSQLEAAGFTNVFDDVDQRVFEVTREELIGRNPDVLVLLHSEGDPAGVLDAVTSLKGSSSLEAVANDDVMVQLFNFTEPPSPLAVDGLEDIIRRFDR